MLKTIERTIHRRIPVEKVPTVADLRTRRLELTLAALRESLIEDDDLDRFRTVVETLADEFDVIDVALAAVKLAHEAGGPASDEQDIPDVAVPERSRERGRPGGGPSGGPNGRQERRRPGAATTRLFVGAGRAAGIRPQDLVGAIAGESRLSGRDIGAIEIADRFSLVEVPDDAADDVIQALRRATVKGRRPTVRRDRDR
jgi:ATP-dependent RNA helicase DeaD